MGLLAMETLNAESRLDAGKMYGAILLRFNHRSLGMRVAWREGGG